MVVAAVAAVVVSHRLPTEIDRILHAEINAKFPHLDCVIGRTEIADRRGIVAHNVALYDKVNGRRGACLVTFDELQIDCATSLDTLLTDGLVGSLLPAKVTFVGPKITVHRAQDGTFPIFEKLRPATPTQHKIPVEIVGGQILYTDAASSRGPLTIDGISARVVPQSLAPQSLTPQPTANATSHFAGEPCWAFRVEIASDWVRRAVIEGRVDVTTGAWNATTRIEHLTLDAAWTPILAESLLGTETEANSVQYDTVRGTIDATAEVVRDTTTPLGFRFAIEGKLRHGSAELPQWGQKMAALDASFRATDQGVRIEGVSGHIGHADLVRLTYEQDGLTTIRSAALETEVHHITVSDTLLRRFVPKTEMRIHSVLDRATFETTANIRASLVHRSGAWRPVLIAVEGANTSICSHAFPYRVDHLGGWLTLTEDDLKFVLKTGATETTPVHLEGHLSGLTTPEQISGKIKVSGQHIAITPRLIEMLPPKPRQVVASLHPEGNLSAMILVEIVPRGPLKKYVEVGLERCSIRYDKFPYPLTNLDGFLVMQDDRWTFNNIIGQHETATVRGFGHIFPRALDPSLANDSGRPSDPAAKDYEFFLSVSAVNIPIDGDLPKAILNKRQRDIVTGIRAKGKIHLDAKISYIPSSQRLSVMFTANPTEEGLAICPIHFPYPLSNVEGTIHYVDGRVKVEDFRGHNKEVSVSSSVECRFGTAGDWSLSLDNLTVDRLASNRELQQALPPQLRTVYDTLRIDGPVNLTGWVGFSQGERQETPLRTEWDLAAIFHNNAASVGLRAEHIFGKVAVYGRNEEGDLRVGGSLWLDQATLLNLPMTDITGPFYYSTAEGKIHLGPSDRVAYRLRREQLRSPSSVLPRELGGGQFDVPQQAVDTTVGHPIGARLCDGHLQLQGGVVVGRTFIYTLGIAGSGIQLPRLVGLLGAAPPTQRLEGKMACQAQLRGEGVRVETLGGKGKVWLTDADIYELPSMMRLFQVLRLDEPRRGAFSEGEIDFTLQGNRAILDSVYFEGDTISISGQGDLQLDTNKVDLLMGTRIGNRSTHIPIVSDWVNKAGDQLVQLRVEGVLGNVHVQRVTLPDIRHAITSSRKVAEEPMEVAAPHSATLGSYYVPPQAEVPQKTLRDRITFWR